MTEAFALFSGGDDSLASTHFAMTEGPAEEVLHLDTRSGIPANQEYVRETCDEFGWPLLVEKAPLTLYEFAVKWGFPGTAAHSWAYRWFKERCLRNVATRIDPKPRYVTGVRRHESERRMTTVSGPRDEYDQWVFLNPFWDYRDEALADYRQDHGLPRNPVAKVLHRSGECGCGSFAHRDEELLLFEAHFPDYYDWLMAVEGYVQLEIGRGEPYCFWGHGGLPSKELRALMARHDTPQMTLCDSCLVGEPEDYR